LRVALPALYTSGAPLSAAVLSALSRRGGHFHPPCAASHHLAEFGFQPVDLVGYAVCRIEAAAIATLSVADELID
jgi:hypothetical protein